MGLHLVEQNLILCALLLLGVLIYHKAFPNKKINLLFLLILVLTPPILSILRPGLYESGDFNVHLMRSIEFFRSLSEGNLMPSWAADLNNTYGYPLFIFNYTLPYYIICLFHAVGMSFTMSMKVFLILNFYLSGVAMYYATKLLLKNNTAAFAGAIFYQFSPYHLTDQNYKIPIGEILVFTLLPLIFFCFQKLWVNEKKIWLIITPLLLILLIMSHVLLALTFILFFFVYSVYLVYITKNKKIFFKTLFVTAISFIGGSYVLIGPFLMSKYSIVQKLTHFRSEAGLSIQDLLFSPWRYGLLYQGPKGQINTPIGYIHLLVIVLIAIVILSRKKLMHRKHIIFFLISFIIFLFLSSQFSEDLWSRYIFLVSAAQRMMLIIAFISALLASYFINIIKKRKKIIWFIICITILSSILNWGHRRVIKNLGDRFLLQELPGSTKNVEAHWYANTVWRDPAHPWFDVVPTGPFFKNNNIKNYKVIKKSTTRHSYIIDLNHNDTVSENTLYFAGWKVEIDGKKTGIRPDSEGRISFNVKAGVHYVEIFYKDIFSFMILKLISIFTLIILVGLLIVYVVHSKRKFLNNLYMR